MGLVDGAASVISSVRGLINVVLPFTKPTTPLLQDAIHTVVLCTLLWYGPSIVERGRQHVRDGSGPGTLVNEEPDDRVPEVDQEEPAEQRVEDAEPAVPGNPVAPATPQDDDRFQAPPAAEDGIHGEQDPGGPSRPVQNVGKKKAASLARKDQRRAYHEFMRNQGEAQRARDREEAAQREAELAPERQRRARAEEKMEARRRGEIEKRKEQQRTEREQELVRRKRAVESVRGELEESGYVDLRRAAKRFGGDERWLAGLCRAEGLIGREWREDKVMMHTESGYVVRVSEDDLEEALRRAGAQSDGSSRLWRWEDLGTILENIVRERESAQDLQRGERHARGAVDTMEMPEMTSEDLRDVLPGNE